MFFLSQFELIEFNFGLFRNMDSHTLTFFLADSKTVLPVPGSPVNRSKFIHAASPWTEASN